MINLFHWEVRIQRTRIIAPSIAVKRPNREWIDHSLHYWVSHESFFYPRVEGLESRICPSWYRWSPGTNIFLGDNDWSTQYWGWGGITNWQIWDDDFDMYRRAFSVPGASDTVVFESDDWSNNSMCVVDAAVTVKQIIVRGDYSKTIRLDNNLTVADPVFQTQLDQKSQFSAAFTLEGAGGKFILNQKSRLIWTRGSLKDVTVEVGPGADSTSYFEVRGAGQQNVRQMENVIFMVSHHLTWAEGKIETVGNSQVWIQPTGSLAIYGYENATWGADPSRLTIVNRGTVTRSTGDEATINGTYIVDGGLTRIFEKNLRIGGAAEQAGASSKLDLRDGGTLELKSPTDVLGTFGLRDGTFVTSKRDKERASGRLVGNLQIGNDPDAPGYNP